MNNIIETSINNYLNSKNNDQYEHLDKYWPSQASCYIDFGKYKKLQGKCLRSSYYSCIGVKRDNTQSNLISLSGTYTENMLVDIYKNMGILYGNNLKFEIEKYKISGKVDCFIKEEDNIVGVEIKSIGSNQFMLDMIFGNKFNKPYPKWSHLFQTIIYCYAFKDTVSYFYIQYIRRDNGDRKYFKISIAPYKDKIYPVIDGNLDLRFSVNDILDRYKLLDYYVNNKSIPPMEFKKVYTTEDINNLYKLKLISQKRFDNFKSEKFGDFECKYCLYRNQCDKDN